MAQRYENLIGGEWVAPGDRWFERTNPADTSEVVGIFAAMDQEGVARAVDAAGEGFERWKSTKLLDRGAVLLRAAAIIRERSGEMAIDLTREMGKTLSEARGEVEAAAKFFEYYGGLARAPQGELLADRRDEAMGWTKREPVGTVVLITPWNDPLATPARKLGPALICGNAVVLKPASHTPISAVHLARALEAAGLPPGALNTVTGSGSVVGSGLASAERVAAVSFTGSNLVGMALKEQLAGREVRLQTEMGGKNASLVLADADLELAAGEISAAAWGQTGQRCTATSRVVVHQQVYWELLDRLVRRAEAVAVGPGTDEATEMGPLVSAEQLDLVLEAVEKSQGQGARVACGGERLEGQRYERGHFMRPTILVDVDSGNVAWQEELFGPVLAVRPAASLEEGIELVNEGRYGLSANIFTNELGGAHRFAEEVEAGQVAINLPTAGWDVHVPFGGYKASGSPFKEQGLEGLRFYSRIKSVVLRVP
jgi:acyl-CoA reductase-like NAD-dependent aldehyde dehydrogenase